VETTMEVQFHGRAVVVTTGTFLRGLMHIGSNQQAGGRAGDVAAMSLSSSLQELGLELGRFKTGTPPRLLRRSIDFAKTEPQHGDEPVPYFTYWKDDLFHMEQNQQNQPAFMPSQGRYPPQSILDRINGQMPCYITYTTQKTANLIRENIHKSPLYSGVIEGVGPRYCPSIEDKIVRFSDKERHQIFLEPEGIETDEIYRSMCRLSWSERLLGVSTLKSFARPMRSNMTSSSQRNCYRRWRQKSVVISFWPARLMAHQDTKRLEHRVL